MSQLNDQATELEELHRQAALMNQTNRAKMPKESAYECQECGEPIPEARRQAIIGCCCCIDCQQELEKYGKTQVAAR